MAEYVEIEKTPITKRLSYTFFFLSCAVFLCLSLICFFSELIGIEKIISTDIVFLVSAVLGLLGSSLALFNALIERKITIKKEYLKQNFEIGFLVFAIFWSFLATIFAIKQDIVWLGNTYNKEGFLSILGYGAIAISAYNIKSKDRKKLLKLFILASTIPATYLLFVNIFSIKTPISPTRSIYRNSNHYGYALCVLVVLSACFITYEKKWWQRLLYSCTFTILHANLLVTDCFGAHVGELAGLGVLIIIRLIEERKLKYTILLIVGLLAVSTTILEITKITNITDDYATLFKDIGGIASGGATGNEGSSRFELWGETLTIIAQVPFFGKGLDCYYNNNVIMKIDMPHNEYLQIASNVGIPVLLCYLAFLVVVYTKAIRGRKELKNTQKIALIGGVSYLVSALFGNTFLYTYPILIIMVAFGLKRRKIC